MQSGVLDG
jgi:environmental stress-induced protein Ves